MKTDSPRSQLGLGGAVADVLLALAAVLLAAWAHAGGGEELLEAPLAVASTAASAKADATVRIDRDNVVHWNDKPLESPGLLDAELLQTKPRSVRVVASGECLHAAVRQVLESLARQGVASARLEAAP